MVTVKGVMKWWAKHHRGFKKLSDKAICLNATAEILDDDSEKVQYEIEYKNIRNHIFVEIDFINYRSGGKLDFKITYNNDIIASKNNDKINDILLHDLVEAKLINRRRTSCDLIDIFVNAHD
jgi:hypothetical protein